MSNFEAVQTLEDLQQRHRKEKKELQGKIQALKKSAAKGDKKKKKEISEEIARLEADIAQRQHQEIANYSSKNCENLESSDPVESLQQDLQNGLNININNENRISKAQRRRIKKVTQLKERELRILEEDKKNLDGARSTELEEIKSILKKRDLMVREVPSDGNCLYNAILKRLEEVDGQCPSVLELRSEIGSYLRENRVEFLPYLSHPDTGNMLTDEQYEEYCDQVANTTAWGGEVELRALSHVLKRPIEVIQAKGSSVIAGAEYKGIAPAIEVTYHRHMYGLGEHYNSVTDYKEESDTEEPFSSIK